MGKATWTYLLILGISILYPLAQSFEKRVYLYRKFLFFFPGILAFIIAGTDYAGDSWFYKEVSVMSPANVPIFQFKTIIPVAGGLLLLQGIAQVCRCIVCIRTGEWPMHLEDVEEMETMMQHQHDADGALEEFVEHVKGEDKK